MLQIVLTSKQKKTVAFMWRMQDKAPAVLSSAKHILILIEKEDANEKKRGMRDFNDVSNGFLVITLKVSGSNIVLQSIFTNLEEILFGSCQHWILQEERVLCMYECNVVSVCVCVWK